MTKYLTVWVVTVLAVACGARAEDKQRDELGGAVAVPMAAAWQYSSDDGKTFAKGPLPGPPRGTDPRRGKNKNYPYVFKGTFTVQDPASIGGLWVRLVEDDSKTPKAAICNGDLGAASGGYWKDLGYCPTLLHAQILLNGRAVSIASAPTLFLWAPVLGELKAGENTIELRGSIYTYWGGAPAKSIAARLVAAAPQPAKIYNGPILGDFGDGYFTLACRTQLPTDLVVQAMPTDQAGKPKITTVTSKNAIWHRVKVRVPPGTREVTYSLTAKSGSHETKSGPWTVTFPGKAFRFIAFGNTMGHSYAVKTWGLSAHHILQAKPAFLLNTGTPMEHGSWEFGWEPFYCLPGRALFASVPTFITPGTRDFSGPFHDLHYTPGPEGRGHSWTKVVGPVRLIGLDGYQSWDPKGDNYQWLEGVLKDAKEKFVVVMDGFPGYSSGKSSRHLNYFTQQTRDLVLPLLGKYKATVLLCSWDPDYERVEPTPDKGCTQIVTGASGKYAKNFSRALGYNPFGPSKSKQWKGFNGHHFCVFEVKGDTLELKVYQLPADLKTPATNVVDTKTFKAR